jgi:hypothetical protein
MNKYMYIIFCFLSAVCPVLGVTCEDCFNVEYSCKTSKNSLLVSLYYCGCRNSLILEVKDDNTDQQLAFSSITCSEGGWVQSDGVNDDTITVWRSGDFNLFVPHTSVHAFAICYALLVSDGHQTGLKYVPEVSLRTTLDSMTTSIGVSLGVGEKSSGIISSWNRELQCGVRDESIESITTNADMKTKEVLYKNGRFLRVDLDNEILLFDQQRKGSASILLRKYNKKCDDLMWDRLSLIESKMGNASEDFVLNMSMIFIKGIGESFENVNLKKFLSDNEGVLKREMHKIGRLQAEKININKYKASLEAIPVQDQTKWRKDVIADKLASLLNDPYSTEIEFYLSEDDGQLRIIYDFCEPLIAEAFIDSVLDMCGFFDGNQDKDTGVAVP